MYFKKSVCLHLVLHSIESSSVMLGKIREYRARTSLRSVLNKKSHEFY